MNITVLIANYNYGRYLEKALNSVVNQTLKPYTVCYVDDNSSDNSWEVFSSFVNPGLIEESVENSQFGQVFTKIANIGGINFVGIKLPIQVGPSEARNVGIDFTKQYSDLYAILDADDQFLPTKLEECVKPFSNPQIGLVWANYYNENSETGLRLLEIKPSYDVYRLSQECIVHSGFVIRKTILEAIKDSNGYYDRTMRTCEDWDLEIRVSKICILHHIATPLTIALVHPKNSTNSVDKSVWEANWNRIRQKHSKGQ